MGRIRAVRLWSGIVRLGPARRGISGPDTSPRLSSTVDLNYEKLSSGLWLSAIV